MVAILNTVGLRIAFWAAGDEASHGRSHACSDGMTMSMTVTTQNVSIVLILKGQGPEADALLLFSSIFSYYRENREPYISFFVRDAVVVILRALVLFAMNRGGYDRSGHDQSGCLGIFWRR